MDNRLEESFKELAGKISHALVHNYRRVAAEAGLRAKKFAGLQTGEGFKSQGFVNLAHLTDNLSNSEVVLKYIRDLLDPQKSSGEKRRALVKIMNCNDPNALMARADQAKHHISAFVAIHEDAIAAAYTQLGGGNINAAVVTDIQSNKPLPGKGPGFLPPPTSEGRC
jgi:hypothetical protein